MMALVRKDLYLSKSLLKTYLLLVGVFVALTLTGLYSVNFLTMLFGMLLIMVSVNTFAYDEQAGWDKYAAATPAGRRGVVQGKYLFTLFLAALCLVLSVVINVLLFLIGRGGGSTLTELLLLSISSVGVCAGLSAVILPLIFKFGSQKSRIWLIIVIAAIVSATTILISLVEDSALPTTPLVLLVPVAAVLLVLASYFVSLRIYAKKEL